MKKIILLGHVLLFSTLITTAQSELFGVELGQFFEQGYGAELNEEAMDLTGFISSNHAIVGWSERYSEGAEGTPGGGSEGTNLDATVWFTDHMGGLIYEEHFGSIFYDEVATGVTAVDVPDEYAICIHQSPDYQGHVEDGDVLIVKRLDSQGSLLWTYTHPSEEGSYAPVDILFAEDLNAIYVLANKTYGSFNGGAHSIALIVLDAQGNFLWEQEHQAYQNDQITASEIVRYEEYSLMTVANNTNGNFPEYIQFDMLNPYSVSTPFDYASNVFLFGIDFDPNTKEFYAAGYTLDDESDVNALVWKNALDGSFIQDFEVGIIGTEKFKDITLTSTGFLAGGVRDNKGEGGEDVFVAHFDTQGGLILEETFGGITNDRFNAFWIDPISKDYTFFAGHDVEYGIDESGNAYVGGIKTTPANIATTCKIPRVFLVDQLFTFNNTTITSNISSLSQVMAIVNHAVAQHSNTLLLYGVDVLLEKPNSTARTNALANLNTLCIESLKKNIRVGIIVGYSKNKINLASNFISTTRAVNGFNFFNAGKLNFMMLEHEIWNPKNNITDLNGNDWTTAANEDVFYEQLVLDHQTLLLDMNNKKQRDGNVWYVLDYMSYPFNTQPKNSSTSPNTISDSQHRKDYTAMCENNSDYILLAYYQQFKHNSGTDFLVSGAADWRLRLQDFGLNGVSRYIPLFSAEANGGGIVCQSGDFLGRFLGGTPNSTPMNNGNNFKSAEAIYLTQEATVPNLSNNLQLSGFAWYGYQCYKNKTYSGTDAELNNCSSGVYIGQSEVSTLSDIEFYPNPASEYVEIKNIKNGRFAYIYSLDGKLLSSRTVDPNATEIKLNLSGFSKGIYLVKITLLDETITKKLCIQ